MTEREAGVFDLLFEHGIVETGTPFDRGSIATIVAEVRKRPDFPLEPDEVERQLRDLLGSATASGDQFISVFGSKASSRR